MAKLQSSYFVCFAFSIFVNLFFVLKLYVGGEWELSWSRRAAEEAEHVAAISCSGHGRAYLDGLVLDGKEPVCESNSCYGGPECSEFLTACAANADKGWLFRSVIYISFDTSKDPKVKKSSLR
ncbi:hypothetical protein GBA52_026052 [Prunus armeniaca]|nr:hypothetical protein GBA52_026052 [Prunus armeniaca]